MVNLRAVDYTDANIPQPGVDLRWPASSIWRPGEPAVYSIGLADLRDAVAKGIEDFNAVPSHAVFLGIIYAILGFILFRLSFGYDVLPLVYPMLARDRYGVDVILEPSRFIAELPDSVYERWTIEREATASEPESESPRKVN